MKFSNEQEKQAYIDNIEKMVSEITKVEYVDGFKRYKIHHDIGQCCHTLEKMYKEVEDLEVKGKIITALIDVEAFFIKRLEHSESIIMMDKTWCANTIIELKKSLNTLEIIAPTARTAALYSAFVEKYSKLLQEEIDTCRTVGPFIVLSDSTNLLEHELRIEIESVNLNKPDNNISQKLPTTEPTSIHDMLQKLSDMNEKTIQMLEESRQASMKGATSHGFFTVKTETTQEEHKELSSQKADGKDVSSFTPPLF